VEQSIACSGSNGTVTLQAESIPFADIPGQSRLFLQYQSDPLSLKKFYPSAVSSHTQIADRIPVVLANHKTDRGALCDALAETNRGIGAGEKVFENIDLLRDPGCVAVVTGQQAGLFTGPLYTLYKALSAVRGSECLRGRGFHAVPVFWVASEDHDFEEVSKAVVLNGESHLAEIESETSHKDNVPVGLIELDESVEKTLDLLFSSLRSTEFSELVKSLLRDAWSTGTPFGKAFAKMLTALTAAQGLIILDPLQGKIKELAKPIYVEAINKADQVVGALLRRSKELLDDGYEPQVAITEDYFPLFWHAADGQRLALRKTSKGTYKVKGADAEFSREELARTASDEPGRFSPNVVLRSVVQDYLLPTVCYFGGGAEVAYFAQNSEVYRVLGRPVTPILHRQSFSVVETKHRRTMQKYGLTFTDLFRGLDELLPRIVDDFLDREIAETFADVEEKINAQLSRLDRELTEIDPTLADNLATRRRKIAYHIAALRDKARRVELNKDKEIRRRIEALFESLVPNGGLQERTLNIAYFLNQYGTKFVDWMYRATDLDDSSHRVIYF